MYFLIYKDTWSRCYSRCYSHTLDFSYYCAWGKGIIKFDKLYRVHLNQSHPDTVIGPGACTCVLQCSWKDLSNWVLWFESLHHWQLVYWWQTVLNNRIKFLTTLWANWQCISCPWVAWKKCQIASKKNQNFDTTLCFWLYLNKLH